MEGISISRQDLISPQKVDGLEDAKAGTNRHQIVRVIDWLKGNVNWPRWINDMEAIPDKIDDNQALHQKDMEKQWTESADFCNKL
jgi:hypothetical protein